MPVWCFLLAGLMSLPACAQKSQPLETPYTPFDFDSYRRNPLQARQPASSALTSKDSRDLQRSLISGEGGKKEDISTRAAALFSDPKEIPLRQEPEPLPTPKELTDEVTSANYGQTTKGQQDLLARGRVTKDLDLSSMSETDYELYVSQRRLSAEETPAATGEALLRPMPTVINSKTGGPPHAYAVTQAGVGARSQPRNDQNPFEDLIRALRLDKPVTKGNDPLPSPSTRLSVTPTTAAATFEKPSSTEVESPSDSLAK